MTDHGEDLLVLHKVLEGGLTLYGIELIVHMEEGDLPAVDAAGLVYHVQIGLNA
ncbi:hypothetical protein SDC9_137582 [bioreactor metagenome]|uniref:Uncharacterized protein n=1 Tax=bioreactor metagenome TaxID=1076179 RepID=A0A645DMH6_9ZZZZ